MTTRGPAAARPPVISRVASSPSISGIRTSIRTTSGAVAAAAATAWAPLAASPATLMPVGGLQDDAEPGPDQLLVVHDQDPDGAEAQRSQGRH